jgi:hypothetical protein
MPLYRMQVSLGADSALPRDRVVMTPHFATEGLVDDAQALTDDLAAALAAFDMAGAAARETKVTAYVADDPAPNRPVASTTLNPQVTPASRTMREVAMCLSFFSEFNEPRRRGRLYVPFFWIASGTSIPPRPDEAHRTRVGQLATIFQELGGANVDWVVYSRADQQARAVTHWWVDDEFDVQRRRGLRSTTRTTGTTSELTVTVP